MRNYIIYLPQIDASVETANNLYGQLKSYKQNVKLYEGVFGSEAIKRQQEEFRTLHPWGVKGPPEEQVHVSKDDIVKESPGVLGCFYSHYDLWKLCFDLGKPIAIWEDDIVLRRNYIPIKWNDVLVLALGHPKKSPKYMHYLEDPTGEPSAQDYYQSSMPGCCGYAIKPQAAKKLLDTYENTYLPADNAINQHHVQIQIHSHVMGLALTKDDGKISLTRNSYWRKNGI